MKKSLLILSVFLITAGIHGQKNMIDSALNIPLIGFSYAYQFPGGDLRDRYGSNSSIGGQFAIKFKSGLYIGVKAHYLFGGKVKESGILDSIRTSEGGIIEVGGELTDPSLNESGYSVFILGGYLLPLFGPNPNSGLLIAAGPGFLQHQILIDYREANIPQLNKEYRKGYDRLSNGFALNEFIGYMHFGKKKLINFYAGIDLTQAWTKNRRSYDYDLRAKDNTRRFDSLIGLRFGWMFALYRRASEDFYYY